MTAAIAHEFRIIALNSEKEVTELAFQQAERLGKKLSSQQNVPKFSRRIQDSALKMIKELVEQKCQGKVDPYYQQLIELSEPRWISLFSHPFQVCVQKILIGEITIDAALKEFNHPT